jgi:hypothetical protein
MSATGEAKAKEDTRASGAKPRLEERVREREWRPTIERSENAKMRAEAACRRAIACARHVALRFVKAAKEGAA